MISLDRLLGMLAAVGEVTQQDMKSVGTAMNTILSRMGSIKLGRLDDYEAETGESLNDVERALKQQGIMLRDSSGQFRDFDAVLDETAAKWDSFSNVAKNAVAQSFAGTRQRNNFFVLMENYDKAMQYADAAAQSSGSGMEKFNVYTESLTGRFYLCVSRGAHITYLNPVIPKALLLQCR